MRVVKEVHFVGYARRSIMEKSCVLDIQNVFSSLQKWNHFVNKNFLPKVGTVPTLTLFCDHPTHALDREIDEHTDEPGELGFWNNALTIRNIINRIRPYSIVLVVWLTL